MQAKDINVVGYLRRNKTAGNGTLYDTFLLSWRTQNGGKTITRLTINLRKHVIIFCNKIQPRSQSFSLEGQGKSPGNEVDKKSSV